MPTKTICILTSLLFGAWALPLCASQNVNINVNFNITASSCTVNSPNINFNIYTDASVLQNPATATDWQADQSIKLSNCFIGTQSVDATLSGTPDDEDPDGFKNQATGDSVSQGVSVQLKLKDAPKMLHNADVLHLAVGENKSITIPITARLYTTNGNVTPGDVYSMITLTLNYN